MAKPRKPKRQSAVVELREEVTVRRLRARLEKASLHAALKAQKEMLSTYAAADRGRRNKDWRANGISADMAIIPDADTINARARQMVRDSWIAKSAVSAFARNVIGCGIIPVPQAKNADGTLNTELNKQLMLAFWTWASDRMVCDVEKDQTFWQQQTLAESERATVGEAFIVWSYAPSIVNGKIDTRKPIGLKLQAFEPEQLDTTILSHTDPVTNEVREVRGGLELDSFGVVVGYHVFSRNPHDYSFRQSLRSQRIPAERVFHYYKKERVRQKRGVTPLATVLQDMRDSARAKDANLWRMIMEACIGMMVKRDATTGAGGNRFQGILPRGTGDNGTTASGMPTVDWTPGMVAVPEPGTTLEAFIPQAPGNQYGPFQMQIARGVAAGSGISYGQLTRDFTQGTYSGQRQEMLEDRKEFEPLSEMCAHNLILPIFKLFVGFMVLEGRVVAPDYAKDPDRYTAAEYVSPPPTWIDPKAEADALEKLIQLRVITREEIAQMRGHRLADILDKIAAEKKTADNLGITFEENVDATGVLAEAQAKVTTAEASKITAETAAQAAEPDNANLSAIPKEVPNYRLATIETAKCSLCRFQQNGKCSAYDFLDDPNHVCDAFETQPAMEGGKRAIQVAPVPDGERPMDDPEGSFLDRAQRGVD